MASLTACLSYVFLNIQSQAVWGQHLLVAYGNHLSEKSGGISLIDVNNSNAVPISRNFGRAWCMAYHYNTSYIYWTEIGKSSIFRLRYPNNESYHVETVVKAENPRGIALDQTENRLYWTEPFANKIMRCNLDGSEVSVVLNSSLAFPNAIAIHSRTRMVYFSHADNNENIIERCRLDGSARQTFITDNMGIGDVYDIAVDDAPKCTLYWTDSQLGSIKSSSCNGSNISIITSNNQSFPYPFRAPYSLDVDTNFIYFTDRASRHVFKVSKAPQSQPVTLYSDENDKNDVVVFYEKDDAPKCTLYWTDSQLGSIKSSSCNGSNISIITSNNQSFPYPFRAPYSLDVDTNFIYFTDRASRHVFKVSKAPQSQPVTLYSDENDKNGVVVFYKKVSNSDRYTSSLKSKDKDKDASLSGGGIVLGYALGSVIFVIVTLGPSLVMLSLHIGNRLCRRLRKNRLQQNTQHNNLRMSRIEADYDTIADDKCNPTNISRVNEKCKTINESVIEKRRSDNIPALVTFVNSIKYENTVNSNPYISMTTRSTAPKYENTATQNTYMPMISRADTHKYDAVTDAIVNCSQLERPFTEKDTNKHDTVSDITVHCAEAECPCTEKLTDNQNYYNC